MNIRPEATVEPCGNDSFPPRNVSGTKTVKEKTISKK